MFSLRGISVIQIGLRIERCLPNLDGVITLRTPFSVIFDFMGGQCGGYNCIVNGY